MKHALSLAFFLYGLWLLLSGHLEPMLLVLGLASTALTVFLALRMDIVDHESHPLHLSLRLVRYWIYLAREVVVSNIDVIRRIVGRGHTISPCMVELPAPQRSVLGRVLYANSITLTPGTVTVHLGAHGVTVHSLSREGAQALAEGTMARAVPDDVEATGR